MKANELRKKSREALIEELTAIAKERFNLRMQVSMRQLTTTHQLKTTRRDIARIKTILNEKVD
jgi:large subunit ribosomal protein L29